LEIISINPKDKIIITYKEGCDFDDANQIHNYFSQCFPNNTIVSNFSGIVKEITIVRENESFVTPGEEGGNTFDYIY
jgi:hypothetical protein